MIVSPLGERGGSIYSRNSSLSRSVTGEGNAVQQAAEEAAEEEEEAREAEREAEEEARKNLDSAGE